MKIATLAIAAALVAVTAVPANAAYVINIKQVGANVVATGSGSINFLDLSFQQFDFNGSYVHAGAGELFLVDSSGFGDEYSGGVSGPANFGSGGAFNATSSSGSSPGSIGVLGANEIIVPGGYFANDPMAAVTSTWSNTTLATLGLKSGSYVWTWGTNNPDSLTVNIAGSVPEPATWGMLVLGLFGLAALLRARRDCSAAATA